MLACQEPEALVGLHAWASKAFAPLLHPQLQQRQQAQQQEREQQQQCVDEQQMSKQKQQQQQRQEQRRMQRLHEQQREVGGNCKFFSTARNSLLAL